MIDDFTNFGGFAARDLRGMDRWETYTPTRTGWTDVGTPTVSGRFRLVGKQCFWQVIVTPGTTCATTGGTSCVSLPVTPAPGTAGDGVATDATGFRSIGALAYDMTNKLAYIETYAATAHVFHLAGNYEVKG